MNFIMMRWNFVKMCGTVLVEFGTAEVSGERPIFIGNI